MKFIGFIILFLNILSCAVDQQSENYNFSGASPLTLEVTNHPHGFQKTNCFLCHTPQNIHQIDHLQDPSFPFAKALVEQKGLQSCSGCHGSNGITQ